MNLPGYIRPQNRPLHGGSLTGHLLKQAVANQREEGASGGSEIEHARQLCRAGNPFPLIALQWPDLLITKEEDAAFFEGALGDFLNPCLRIDPWQRHVFQAGFDVTVGEIFMKGCTGAGKGFSAGILLNLYYDVYDSCRIFITSQSARHAENNLFGAEFSIRRAKMRHPSRGELLKSQLYDNKRHLVAVLNPSPYGEGEAFSGMHASDGHTIYAFDEASACPAINYTNCLKNATKVLTLSNPRITEGWFREGYRPLQGDGSRDERYERENSTGYCMGRLRRRLCVTISGLDCTNVKHGLLKHPVAPHRGITIGENYYKPGDPLPAEDFEKIRARVPGQIDLDQYQSIIDTSKEAWEVECFAHAKFPSENPIRQAILHSWVEMAQKVWRPSIGVTAFGLDVGRSKSGDPTVLSAGGLEGCREQHSWVDDSNTRHVQRILKIAATEYGIDLRAGEVPIVIDTAGGYGAAVYDRLQQLGCNVITWDPAGTAEVYPTIYRNQRAEWYMLLGRRLDPSDNWAGLLWALPPDEELAEDLSTPTKIPVSGGVSWKLEAKDDLKDRLGRSPDKGDSVVALWKAVFRRYNLVDRMSEGIDNLIIASGYGEEKEAGSEGADLDELIDTDLDSIQLPRPNITTGSEEFVHEILQSLGVEQTLKKNDEDEDFEEDDAFGLDVLNIEDPEPENRWSRYFSD